MAASLDLTYYPMDRGYQFGVGLGRQWLRIRMEEFRKKASVVPIDTVAVPNWCFLLRSCTNRVAASFVPYLLARGIEGTLPTIRGIDRTSVGQDWGVSG